MTSRVLGLVREVVYARFMGDTWVAGAFMLAFMVPNLFRRLLGEGALTAAFIPVFKEKEKVQGEGEMWRAANAVISGLWTSAGVIVLLGIAGISVALAVGEFPDKTHLMLRLLRVMFPYVLLVCLAAIFMGMLNARGHFFVPAMGAATLNVVMIVAVLWLAPRLGLHLSEQIFGLAIGVLAAGVVQALFQLPLLRREGFRYRWVTPWRDETVRRVVRQMIPGAVGVAAFQINVLFTQSIAFWVDATVVASFYYAVRLMELPQGVFGLSLATYLLPTLAGLAAEKKYPEFRSTLKEGLNYILFINLLASILLLVLAEPIIRLLFERGLFDANATARASLALMTLAPGLVAFSMVNILARAFYALSDVRTPMNISLFCLTLNLVLVITLIWRFRQAGLGLANTLSAVCNVVFLLYALRRKLGKLELRELWSSLPALAGAGVVAGAAAWWLNFWWETNFGHASLAMKMGSVFLPMTVASLLYLGICAWARIEAARRILRMLFRLWRAGR